MSRTHDFNALDTIPDQGASRREALKRLGAVGLALAGGVALSPPAAAERRRRRDRAEADGAVRAAADPANGVYYIFPTNRGVIAPVALDVPGGQTANNVKIQLFTFHGGDNQRWQVVRLGADGSGRPLYAVINLASRKALDVPNGAAPSGTPLQQFDFHGGPSQQWRLDASPQAPTNPLFRFVHNPRARLAADVPNGAPASGLRVQLFTPYGGWSQAWVLIRVA